MYMFIQTFNVLAWLRPDCCVFYVKNALGKRLQRKNYKKMKIAQSLYLNIVNGYSAQP